MAHPLSYDTPLQYSMHAGRLLAAVHAAVQGPSRRGGDMPGVHLHACRILRVHVARARLTEPPPSAQGTSPAGPPPRATSAAAHPSCRCRLFSLVHCAAAPSALTRVAHDAHSNHRCGPMLSEVSGEAL